jgi:hypothetical protein
MKDSTVVMGNDWSKDGLRRRAQGTRKLIAESKNRGTGIKGKRRSKREEDRS